MNIIATALASGVATANQSSYTTASITPVSNALVLAGVVYYALAAPPEPEPTISGNGLTWVKIGNINIGGFYVLLLFRAMGPAPTPGIVTIDFGGVVQDEFHWNITQFTNVDTSGVNGSGAIAQVVSGHVFPGTSLTITLGAFSAPSNGTYGIFYSNASTGHTPGSKFTTLASSTDAARVEEALSEFKTSNDTTVDASWSTSSNSIGIAVEIKSSSSPAFRGH